MSLSQPSHVALMLCFSPFHANSARTTRVSPQLVETFCRPSEQPFATLRILLQRPKYPPSDGLSSLSFAPLSSPYPNKLPKHHLLRQTLLPHTCATNRANNILRLRTIAYVPSESVQASASAYVRVWPSRFRFRHPRHRKSMEW